MELDKRREGSKILYQKQKGRKIMVYNVSERDLMKEGNLCIVKFI
jgi:hypothetical protein